MTNKLTPRQARFVEEYLVDLNASAAARRAGYAPKNADVAGPRLLVNVGIAAAIAAAKAKRSVSTGITQERVLRELEALAHSNHTHYHVEPDGRLVLAPGAPPNAHAAISSVKHRITSDGDGNVTREVEIRLWDKPSMLKLAGRHVAAPGFFDRMEVTGKDGGPVQTEQVTRAEALAALNAVMPKSLQEAEPPPGEPIEE